MKLAFIFSLLLPFAAALHASEAGVVDWHKAQIGVPLTHSHSLSPAFHRFGTGTAKKSTKSVVLTVTSANVLAALDPVNGDLGESTVDNYANYVDLCRSMEICVRPI